jgi:hypothetical protein
MWAANLGMTSADSWAIWRAIMMNPGSGPHKRGWTVDTYEYEKHNGSFESAADKKHEEAEHDGTSWAELNPQDIDPEGLPLGEMGPDGILYDHGLYWLYGDSGDGKTVVAYYIAIMRARAGHKVAILDDEMGPNSGTRMLIDLGASHGTLGNIRFLQWKDGETPNLLKSGASLTSFLGDIQADMLILDCMNAYLSAADLNDNYSNDIRKMLQAAVYPSRSAERAVLIIDHKGHSKEEARVRGSSDKMPGCDMMIGLSCPETFQQDQSGHVLLTCDKDRNSLVKGKTLQVDMNVEGRNIRPEATEWFKMEEIEPIRTGKRGRPAKVVTEILDILRENGPLSISGICAVLDQDYEAVRSALRRGEKDGLFMKDSSKWYAC